MFIIDDTALADMTVKEPEKKTITTKINVQQILMLKTLSGEEILTYTSTTCTLVIFQRQEGAN